jgi:hypothetical protein
VAISSTQKLEDNGISQRRVMHAASKSPRTRLRTRSRENIR